eukprot:124964-Ditylum_brightwellii.AAC.1
MPEVQAKIQENLSLAYHDCIAQECTNRNGDSVSIMLPPLAVMLSPAENTQRPVYCGVEMLHIRYKQLNSELAEAIADVAGDTNVGESANQHPVSQYEESAIGGSVSDVSTGTLEKSLVENELADENNFPADQPI